MSTKQELPVLASGTRVLDVREKLKKGQEPFKEIMAALEELKPGQGLAIRAIFEPRPLFGLLAVKGFKGETHRLADDDWLVDFQPEKTALPKETFEEIDVRHLEPPEPLVLLVLLEPLASTELLALQASMEPLVLSV